MLSVQETAASYPWKARAERAEALAEARLQDYVDATEARIDAEAERDALLARVEELEAAFRRCAEIAYLDECNGGGMGESEVEELMREHNVPTEEPPSVEKVEEEKKK